MPREREKHSVSKLVNKKLILLVPSIGLLRMSSRGSIRIVPKRKVQSAQPKANVRRMTPSRPHPQSPVASIPKSRNGQLSGMSTRVAPSSRQVASPSARSINNKVRPSAQASECCRSASVVHSRQLALPSKRTVPASVQKMPNGHPLAASVPIMTIQKSGNQVTLVPGRLTLSTMTPTPTPSSAPASPRELSATMIGKSTVVKSSLPSGKGQVKALQSRDAQKPIVHVIEMPRKTVPVRALPAPAKKRTVANRSSKSVVSSMSKPVNRLMLVPQNRPMISQLVKPESTVALSSELRGLKASMLTPYKRTTPAADLDSMLADIMKTYPMNQMIISNLVTAAKNFDAASGISPLKELPGVNAMAIARDALDLVIRIPTLAGPMGECLGDRQNPWVKTIRLLHLYQTSA